MNPLKMLLVSGGYVAGGSNLDSTEIYDPEVGSWRAGAALPSKRRNLRAVNIDGRILFFGINILSRIVTKGPYTYTYRGF